MSDIAERLKTCEGIGACLSGDPRFAQDTMREGAAEIERLRGALHMIVCNTEPDAIKHRDYEHLAHDIYECANAALSPQQGQGAT